MKMLFPHIFLFLTICSGPLYILGYLYQKQYHVFKIPSDHSHTFFDKVFFAIPKQFRRYPNKSGLCHLSGYRSVGLNDPTKKRVVISRAKLVRNNDKSDILKNTKQQIPELYVDLDLGLETVMDIITDLPKGIYGDIPVPAY